MDEKKKVYVVSYLGLSDNDEDANGYLELKVFDDREKAKAYFDMLVSNEIECLCSEQREYTVHQNEDGLCHFSWSGLSEQVIIKILEETVN